MRAGAFDIVYSTVFSFTFLSSRVVSSVLVTWMGVVLRGSLGVIVRRLLFLLSSSESGSAHVFLLVQLLGHGSCPHFGYMVQMYSADPL